MFPTLTLYSLIIPPYPLQSPGKVDKASESIFRCHTPWKNYLCQQLLSASHLPVKWLPGLKPCNHILPCNTANSAESFTPIYQKLCTLSVIQQWPLIILTNCLTVTSPISLAGQLMLLCLRLIDFYNPKLLREFESCDKVTNTQFHWKMEHA